MSDKNHSAIAEVTGTVWKLLVAVGQRVNEGDELILIESMKMEIPVAAPCAGEVLEIQVAEGDPVREGAVVVLLRGPA